MWFLLFGLLLLASPVAAQTSCTPNNNSIFALSGTGNGTLATSSPQPVGTYVAGIVANVPGTSNTGTCFPVTVVVQTNTGTGCQDVDTIATIMPGAKCDPTMSDDFDRDGGVLNTAKWLQVGQPADTACTITGGKATLDSQGIHFTSVNTGGNNYTQTGQVWWNIPSGDNPGGTAPFYPSGNYVLEYKVVSVTPANDNRNFFVNWTWGKDASAGDEIDFPDFGQYKWIYWTPTWQPGGGIPTSESGDLFYMGVIHDGNPHIIDKVRNGSTNQLYVDGVLKGSFASPQPVFTDSTDGFNMAAGDESGNGCVAANDIIQYVHVGH